MIMQCLRCGSSSLHASRAAATPLRAFQGFYAMRKIFISIVVFGLGLVIRVWV